MYYNEAYADHSIPLLIGLSALAFLYLLNIIAAFVQSAFLCYDKPFTTWKENFALNRFFYYLTSIVSLCTSHKFRNILFCKLFTFGIFSAQLEDVSMFRIFNIFSLLSLVQNAGAIFAAATAISYVKVSGQTYYACIDIIVVSSLNAVMAFFNASKPKDFFH